MKFTIEANSFDEIFSKLSKVNFEELSKLTKVASATEQVVKNTPEICLLVEDENKQLVLRPAKQVFGEYLAEVKESLGQRARSSETDEVFSQPLIVNGQIHTDDQLKRRDRKLELCKKNESFLYHGIPFRVDSVIHIESMNDYPDYKWAIVELTDEGRSVKLTFNDKKYAKRAEEEILTLQIIAKLRIKEGK